MEEEKEMIRKVEIEFDDVIVIIFGLVLLVFGVILLLINIPDMDPEFEVAFGLCFSLAGVVLIYAIARTVKAGYEENDVMDSEKRCIEWDNKLWIFYGDRVYSFIGHAAFTLIKADHIHKRQYIDLFGNKLDLSLVAGEEEHFGLK